MVLRRGQCDRGLAVAQREKGRFLAGEKFLDDDFAAGFAQAAAEHHVDGRFGLGDGLRHHHALAGGEAVGLDHDRRAARARIGLGRIGGVEALIGGGRDAVFPAQILGEALGAFEPCRGPGRSERLDAGGFQVVDDAGAERRLRPDHHKVDAMFAAKRDHRPMIGEVEADAFGLPRDAGIARRAIEPVGERACRHFPGQRMLAPAGAQQQDIHGSERISLLGIGATGGYRALTRARDAQH